MTILPAAPNQAQQVHVELPGMLAIGKNQCLIDTEKLFTRSPTLKFKVLKR